MRRDIYLLVRRESGRQFFGSPSVPLSGGLTSCGKVDLTGRLTELKRFGEETMVKFTKEWFQYHKGDRRRHQK